MNQFKYLFLSLIMLPFLPVMYFQGRKIYRTVPRLPEASGTSGKIEKGSQNAFKLVTIGESTIAGVGVKTHAEGFTGSLAANLAEILSKSIEWNVFAKSGYTAENVSEKLIPKINISDPDLIVVGLGGNDAFGLSSPKKWKKNMVILINELQSIYPDVRIAFTNMPPIKEFPAFTSLLKFSVGNLVEILGDELKRLVKTKNDVFYDSRIISLAEWAHLAPGENSVEDFFSDGVHPSKLTYQTWAREFSKFLDKNMVVRS